MGGSSGGGARTPYEAPNKLSSAQLVRITDVIAEGVIAGFANGDSAPFKSVFFNDTPVQNADGTYNFKGVQGVFQRGTPDQSYVPGFDSTERTVVVSSPVKHGTPIIRAVTDPLINRVRVTVGVERNAKVKDNGDTVAAVTSMLVELVGGTTVSQVVTFAKKSSGAYYQDVVFDSLPAVPFNIRVSRISPDATTDKLQNGTFCASYVEIVDAKLSHPHTALSYLKIDSDQFGNNIPRRNYLIKAKIIQVPSNYNPETREYAGLWDGSFKAAWSNNPAWVFYDLLTQVRYSTLARRISPSDIDKWSLYAVARYCDELVDDGFGGKEPRFVCNAYLTDARQAGELMTDLASVFRGLPIWNGNQVSVVMDNNADPVAAYTNSNVVDGAFVYAGASLKAIHTAVNVQYLDKNDGYRARTEYVQDDEAVKRYGLNIKSVAAFGCTSRGQAARFGAWTLATELNQQNSVTFTVARDGLKHLPYDIIRIADNDYAGVDVGGRIVETNGTTLTLDREVSALNGTLYLTNQEGVQSVKVMAQPAPDKVTVESVPVGIIDVWALANKVKPRLYRAIGIKENTDEGTYSISAILHDERKYGVVDSYASFDREITTLHTLEPEIFNPDMYTDGNSVVVTWDNLGADSALSYDIEVYRNGKLYRHIPDADKPEIRLEGLPNGDYRVKVRARNSRGQLSAPIERAFSINYDITGLKTTPQMFAIKVAWTLPQTVVSDVVTELWYNTENTLTTAQKLVSLPYPQNNYTLGGVELPDVYYFWARVVDKKGITGQFTESVEGRCDTDPNPILQQLQDSITKSALNKELLDVFNAAEGQQADIDSLLAKAVEQGNKIASVENVNATQAQQILTITTVQNGFTAGLEEERQARIDGDAAEASARQTLAVRVGSAESSITTLNQSVADTNQALATQNTTITAKLEENRVLAELARASTEGGVTRIAAPQGGSYTSYNGNHKGAIKIRLPQAATNTMLKFRVEIFNYGTNQSVSYEVAGYNYVLFDKWHNVTATMTGGADATKNVRFGRDADKYCIWIGEIDSEWSYPQIQVLDFVAGYLNYQIDKWASGWEISIVTQFDTVYHVVDTQNPAKSIAAMYTLKVEAIANGRKAVAGLALGADGVTGDSQFLAMANKFAIVNPNNTAQLATPFVVDTTSNTVGVNGQLIVNGSILGRHIAANQSITAPVVSGGTITGARIEGNTIVGGRIEGVDGVFSGKVYIENLIGGQLNDSATISLSYWKETDRRVLDSSGTIESTKWFKAVFIVDSSKAERILKMDSLGTGGSPPATWVVSCKTDDNIALPKMGQVTLAANRSFTFTFTVNLRNTTPVSNYTSSTTPSTISYTTTPTNPDGGTVKTIRQV